MLEEQGNDGDVAGGHRKTYLRSVSWSDRWSPSSCSNPSSNPKQSQPFSNKARASLPPLQPLCISRRPVEEWPRPGSDDLGHWPHPPTPSANRSRPPSSSASSSPRPLDVSDTSTDFLLRKDKLAFFDKECSRIADHIYLGSDAVARNREILRQNGITHVLNCVGFVSPEYFKNDLIYKTLWLQDSPSEDITSILYDVFDYFEDVREQGGRVLVHCCQGVSRSTSLVIAYLMWRDGQSFEDAFQFVKAARGITNPNMGFACQLLQCQKRVHAVPASPNSVLRMYRMAPHSSYDSLHLVPKMLNHPSALGLDSRGAFIVHVPSVIYIWVGKNCTQVMLNHASAAASQVVRYERAQGPIVNIDEGKEPSEFWDALANCPLLTDDFDRVGKDKDAKEEKDRVAAAISLGVGNKKVSEYDVDYEIFHKALSGGVVPPVPLSATGSEAETHLPARENCWEENGWGKLRWKFASGKLLTSSKLLTCNNGHMGDKPDTSFKDSCNNDAEEQPRSPTDSWLSPSPPCRSPDSFSCYSNTSSTYNSKSPLPSPSEEHPRSPTDSWLSPSHPCRSPDSFSCFSNTSPTYNSKSPLPSPSYSSSSFTFSPGSSNWSDLSFLSSQPSPSSSEFKELMVVKGPSTSPSPSLEGKTCLQCTGTFSSLAEPFAAPNASRVEKACVPCKGNSPSLAERRGSSPPSLVLSPSVNKHMHSKPSRNIVRSWSFSLPDLEEDMMLVDNGSNQSEGRGCDESNGKELMSHTDLSGVGSEVQEEYEKEFSLRQPVLYRWPAMEKVEMPSSGVLDSRSVFLFLAQDVKLGDKKPKILYVWVGCDVPSEEGQYQLIHSDLEDKHSPVYWEKVGRIFLNHMGVPMDVPIQVIRDSKAPEQLIDGSNRFSFQQVEDYCHN
ncbi:protein-tyrosine-phosphatase MKP1-like [Telopea speciosissima]|uniref:protein-tyrosine-phosphatase MKP1-like n=1 Tax=Telopea speciosissima TaxID=54955 RepID=UPI001CC6CBCF|nr:protein-tyrosine-phosphatase MKP1-like [Telopea speciosissima]